MVEEWDHMDLKPSNLYVALEESEIHNWCEQMNKNYSGRTTKYIRTLEKNEAYHWALDTIHEFVSHPRVKMSDGSLDSVDVDRIKNIYKMLEKSYQ